MSTVAQHHTHRHLGWLLVCIVALLLAASVAACTDAAY